MKIVLDSSGWIEFIADGRRLLKKSPNEAAAEKNTGGVTFLPAHPEPAETGSFPMVVR